MKDEICRVHKRDNYESKMAKRINKNVGDGELKYEDCKNLLFNRSYMKSKDYDMGSYILECQIKVTPHL